MIKKTRAQRKAEHALGREVWMKRYERERQRNVAATPGPLPMVIVLDSLKAGFNVPKIFRSGEAFGVHEIHLVNIGPFDPAPAKGAFRKVPTRLHDEFGAAYDTLTARGYTLFALDPQAPESLPDAELPERSAFVFGHEEHGLSFDPADYPGLRTLSIPHAGPIQSLNVSVAASIVMYEYVRRSVSLPPSSRRAAAVHPKPNARPVPP
ncbi:TrmH family RNA methyltransferase [Endothiovibrio diazotrophicus]